MINHQGAGGGASKRHQGISPHAPSRREWTLLKGSTVALKNYTNSKTWLGVEFAALFFGLPVAFFTVLKNHSPVPFLLALALLAAIYLLRSPGYDRRRFFNIKLLLPQLPRIIIAFLVSATALLIFVWLRCPDYLFFCPRHRPALWTTILWAYPLLAVYPQELIYRGFLFQRYGPLFPSQKYLVHVSALAFAFGHIIYWHPYSMLLTLAGGYLFAYTYRQSRSLLAASLEHALYGCFIYTVGLGRFFFSGIDQLPTP